jgi:hypothetical protein
LTSSLAVFSGWVAERTVNSGSAAIEPTASSARPLTVLVGTPTGSLPVAITAARPVLASPEPENPASDVVPTEPRRAAVGPPPFLSPSPPP